MHHIIIFQLLLFIHWYIRLETLFSIAAYFMSGYVCIYLSLNVYMCNDICLWIFVLVMEKKNPVWFLYKNAASLISIDEVPNELDLARRGAKYFRKYRG
jgi:hypothetical protein